MSDSDNSPPRRRNTSPDNSPPRRRNLAPDNAPPRRRNISPDNSPPRRRNISRSPPRRRNVSPNNSPPRRRNTSPDNSPPRRRNTSPDNSPPRRRNISRSPPRRRSKSPDNSPPRRRNLSRSPPRRQNLSNESPPRRRRNTSPNNSPSRNRKYPAKSSFYNKTQEKTYNWGKAEQNKPENDEEEEDKPKKKVKPNFEKSGKLFQEANSVNGVGLVYVEPPDAKTPTKKWRFYPFKGEEAMDAIFLYKRSHYLLGRDRMVCAIPLDHPSCSKQHSVVQFKIARVELESGEVVRAVKPYIMDLGSTNGTMLNNEKIEPQRYIELKEGDVLKFGFSSRDYVLLHDKSV